MFLSLQGSRIFRVDPDAFDRMPRLVYLNLSSCHLSNSSDIGYKHKSAAQAAKDGDATFFPPDDPAKNKWYPKVGRHCLDLVTAVSKLQELVYLTLSGNDFEADGTTALIRIPENNRKLEYLEIVPSYNNVTTAALWFMADKVVQSPRYAKFKLYKKHLKEQGISTTIVLGIVEHDFYGNPRYNEAQLMEKQKKEETLEKLRMLIAEREARGGGGRRRSRSPRERGGSAEARLSVLLS